MLNIDIFLSVLKRYYPLWDVPVITRIAGRGATPFEILVSTVLSLRTKDKVTEKVASKLLAVANTPEAMLGLQVKAIESLIYPAAFYPTKSKRLLQISRILIDSFNGKVPDRMDQLLLLPGVGRKTANLVLVEGFKQDAVCVDTHVHRISNRIGYVNTQTPEKTELALREKLPRQHWVAYNEILVAFGHVICRPVSPWCSRCPVSGFCSGNGVVLNR